MDNQEKKHPLVEIWDNYPGMQRQNRQISQVPPIEQILGEMFAIGEFYYYVLNLTNSTVSHHRNKEVRFIINQKINKTNH